MEENIKNIVDRALEMAKNAGCSDSRAGAEISVQSSFSVRNNMLDRLNSSTGSTLFLQLFIDGRYGYYSTNRTDEKELKEFIGKAAEATKLIAPDHDRILPPKELLFKGETKDLGQFDPSYNQITPEEKREIAFQCSKEIFEKDPRIISTNCEYGDSLESYYMADTQGFCGESKQTSFSVSAECSAIDRDGAKPEAWWYESSMDFSSLEKEGCGKIAMERALARLGPRKMKSGLYNMVLENSVASRVVSPIISALNGSAIHQNNSFLADKLGMKLFPENLYIMDRPHLYGYEGSRFFDSEGLETKSMNIIDGGVIQNYYLNTYNARKLGMEPTIEGPSLLSLSLNNTFPTGIPKVTQKEVLNECGKGILVTGFNGGNSNSASGDFSFGVQGFYFENGIILHPIKEMNVTGNILELWNSLKISGDDPKRGSRWLIPTLMFESVTFNGN
ncbi:MAG: TldD/PmbA family protein [Bacteroidales bacterium]|nr:TldD/PmbA family protein [Bacteroidales bacterium]